jgi:hypothetical protein
VKLLGILGILGAAISVVFAMPSSLATASPGGNPFYVVPVPQTNECTNVPHCSGVTGPWVVIPAHREATFLLRCPERHGFSVGGTDARVSSPVVQVWFDGELGAPIGTPSFKTSTGAAVLFHATSGNGKPGWFQPTVGCSSLAESSERSTVSALPGIPAGPPPDLHAVSFDVTNAVRYGQRVTCPRTEKLGSWWASFAFLAGPPELSLAGNLFSTRHAVFAHRSLVVAIRTGNNLDSAAGAYPEEYEIQVGIACHARSKS